MSLQFTRSLTAGNILKKLKTAFYKSKRDAGNNFKIVIK